MSVLSFYTSKPRSENLVNQKAYRFSNIREKIPFATLTLIDKWMSIGCPSCPSVLVIKVATLVIIYFYNSCFKQKSIDELQELITKQY